MDKADKKRRKTQWRDEQRKAAVAAFPLPFPELKAMFNTWLDSQGGFCDCEILANVEQSVEEATGSTIVAYRRNDMS